jgi:hypothetical protein
MILIKRGSLNNSPLVPFVTFASHGVHVGIAATHNHNCSHNTMASKRSTNTNMTNEVRIALCEHKKKHPSLTQADLITWFQERRITFLSVRERFLWHSNARLKSLPRRRMWTEWQSGSSRCSKTLSTMRCLLASRQSRTRSALWGLTSSFRSQSGSISPRFSCPNVEKFVSNLCLP